MLRARSGRDRKLVVGCTRADALATYRDGAVTVVIAVMDVAVADSIAPVSAGIQHTADSDSADARWRQWTQQGRADEARFRRKMRTVLVDVFGVVALGGAAWFVFEPWL